jgi:nicotinamide-nucleotide amidase
MKAIIITVGDELLIGQVVDTNSAWLGGKLNGLGLDLIEIRSVSDKSPAIIEAIGKAFENAEIVIMTGGLGPTKDDITKKAIADYFGVEMVFHEETYQRIVAIFEKFGKILSDSHKEQCLMPTNAQLLRNNLGTAPGMMFENGSKLLFSLPGVPYEMKGIFEDEMFPILKAKIGTSYYIHHRTIMTAGEGETFLADQIEDLLEHFTSEMSIAYLPSLGTVRLRISGKSEFIGIKDSVDKAYEAISDRLGKYVYGAENESLEKALLRLCKANSLTLGTAESCTGGYLAHRITSVPGSSVFFQGSVVSYSNAIKMNLLGVKAETLDSHGAVSKETVSEMAIGGQKLLGTDICIAISGIAGPDGGTLEKPVGTIWFGLAYKDRPVYAFKVSATKKREKNIEYSANVAMTKIIREILYDNG